jgi:uncharacterized membrane protein YebE (DUF533 family)
MLRKLITLAATAALGKKAYDAYRQRQVSEDESERKALEAMAAQIQPQSDNSQVKPARKGGQARSRKRSDGPSAD